MPSNEELKKIVKDKYSQIAEESSCCGTGCCSTSGDDMLGVMADDYKSMEGHFDDADLGLGCGIPTEFIEIKEGMTVLDLGSGAGNDVFIAAKSVGESGKVIGVDMTEEMIKKANQNKEKLAVNNVEFKLGEIDDMPIEDDSVDVVISNCVLNLVPDKDMAFDEIYRVIKVNGKFCISDIVLDGNLPDALKEAAELYAGCVSGASQLQEYIGIIQYCGFEDIEIHKKKKIVIPHHILEQHLSQDEMLGAQNSDYSIYSITVSAVKKV